MTCQYRYTFTDDYLVAATLRYRQQLPWSRPFYAFKGLLSFIFLVLGAIVAYAAEPWLLIPFGAVAGALFLGWPIDSWILKRRFRESPYRNDEIMLTLSEEGIQGAGKTSETRYGWPVITKARFYPDGLLIFQGPHLFHWLPDSAAVDSSTRSEAMRLIRAHVSDVREV